MIDEQGSNRLSILNGRPWLTGVENAGFVREPVLEIRNQRDVAMKDNILVISRVRDGEVAARVGIANHSGRVLSLQAEAKIYDVSSGKLAASLKSKPIDLDKEEEGEKEFTFPAGSLTTWSPETPQLYRLVLSVHEGQELIDVSWPVRFGYREVWVEDGEIFLTGDRLSIRGKSHNYLGDYGFGKTKLRMLKETGQNADRTLLGLRPNGKKRSMSPMRRGGWSFTMCKEGQDESLKSSIEWAITLQSSHGRFSETVTSTVRTAIPCRLVA